MTRWENIFTGIGALALLSVLLLLGTMLVSEKKVTGYSLDETDGKYSIEKHVEWDADSYIRLDRTGTLSEAIRMVDSLNKTIKN